MIQIKEMSRDFTEIEKYLMTISPAITSMKDVPDGEGIRVSGTLLFDDIKPNGDKCEILSIITPDNKVYSCQSTTFKRSIADITSIMHGESFPIIKISGKTKGGRDFINCMLDVVHVNTSDKVYQSSIDE